MALINTVRINLLLHLVMDKVIQFLLHHVHHRANRLNWTELVMIVQLSNHFLMPLKQLALKLVNAIHNLIRSIFLVLDFARNVVQMRFLMQQTMHVLTIQTRKVLLQHTFSLLAESPNLNRVI